MLFIGYLSALFLTVCGIPDVYIGIKTGIVNISNTLLYLWIIGEALGLIYVIPLKKTPLILNYSLNVVIISLLILLKRGVI